MKKIFLFIAFIAVILGGQPVLQADPSIEVGTAKVEITPPVGTPLAGYGKRHGKPSQGVHDPLYARALSATNGQDTFVFVSLDLVLIDENLREEILRKVRKQKALRPEQLVLFATHTHSGSGAIGGRFWEKFIMGKFRKKVFAHVTDGAAAAILKSLESPVKVLPELGSIRIDELIENRLDEKLKGPHQLRVLRFKKENGDITASLIFMAAHATLLPASNLEISADFPGALTATAEKNWSGSVDLFVNGAAGDLRPKAPAIENRMMRMEAYTSSVFEKVKSISFESAPINGPWTGVSSKIKLPAVKARAGFLKIPAFVGGRVFPRKSTFQTIRMGNLIFMAFPAEVSSETGHDIEKWAASKNLTPLFIGYANDYLGYVIPRRYYFDLNQYEARASFYGPKMDWFLQEQAFELIKKTLTDSERSKFSKPGSLRYEQGLPVLFANGDAYHLGFEEGRLLKKEIGQAVNKIFHFLNTQVPAPLINRLIVNHFLDNAWEKMEPYISYEEYLQMKGLADGSGISFSKIKRLHAIPEIYPAWCASGAYWGAGTKSGNLIAIRNLDWNRKIGIHHFAAVKFLKTPGQQAYINIGYYGFTGILSGINENGFSVGEVGATSSDETIEGVPMPFLLKRVLAEAGSIEEAVGLLEKSNLTRGYNYIFADALSKKAVAIEATHSHLALFEAHDSRELNISYSLPVSNAVFRSDTALDPVIRDLQWTSKGNPKKPGIEPPGGGAYEIRYRKHGQLILENYGRIDPEIAKQMAKEIAPGSNIQSVVYAFPDFWVANAKDNLRAVETEYAHFNFEELEKSSELSLRGVPKERRSNL